MHRKQAGVTLIGWIFLLIPLAIVGYSAIRLVPIYLNYMRVARSVSQVADEAAGDESTSARALQVSLAKRLDIEGVEFPDLKNFVIRRDGRSWVIEVSYEETAPLISNVQLLISFDKSARVGSGQE